MAPGVGVSSTVDVVDASGASVCDSVAVEEYGVIVCMTKAMEINSEIMILKDGETFAWYSRAVTDEVASCPDVPDIYTPEYWIAYYQDNYDIDQTTYEEFAYDNLRFNFGDWFLANNDTLIEDDIDLYLLDNGSFNWTGYHMDYNWFLTEEDIS
jgi:hypothetical protein